MFDRNLIIGLIVVAVFFAVFYAYAPKLLRGVLPGYGVRSGSREGFASSVKSGTSALDNLLATNGTLPSQDALQAATMGAAALKAKSAAASEGFSDYQDTMGPVPMAQGSKPGGCYPREQINPTELLPADTNSQWAQVNPQGAGDVQGKNFLSAGALVGVNTIGQSLRNPNYQLRAEPPNPQVQVGPWAQSTIEPDLQRRPLE
jgi:hypothetical protein